MDTVMPDADRDADGWLAYRIFYNEPIPSQIQVVTGDAIANLRATLESVAFELARICQSDRRLKHAQLRQPTFPIYADPAKFDRDYATAKLSALYSPAVRDALRTVQPFADLERVKQDSTGSIL